MRCVQTYEALLPEQLFLLLSKYPREFTKNVIDRLDYQRRLFFDYKYGCFIRSYHSCKPNMDRHKALWVLGSQILGVKYHTTGDSPVEICFERDNRVFFIATLSHSDSIEKSETVLQLAQETKNCIVVIDDPSQQKSLGFPETTVFCTVSKNGQVHYF